MGAIRAAYCSFLFLKEAGVVVLRRLPQPGFWVRPSLISEDGDMLRAVIHGEVIEVPLPGARYAASLLSADTIPIPGAEVVRARCPFILFKVNLKRSVSLAGCERASVMAARGYGRRSPACSLCRWQQHSNAVCHWRCISFILHCYRWNF